MNTENICDNKPLQQRIFSVMKQEVCNDSYSVYSAFVFQSLSSLSSTSTYTTFTLQKWVKPC